MPDTNENPNKRIIDLPEGWLYVVTDLHGSWDAYTRYRADFLRLHEQGRADTLLFLGDLVHGYGKPEDDFSLDIVWDIIQLQEKLGRDRVVALLGNHELPHIYGVTLYKGNLPMTPRFEHRLGEYREPVIEFFRQMPFIARTSGGVMFNHAGASAMAVAPAAVERLRSFSHTELLHEADQLVARQDVQELIEQTIGMSPDTYAKAAWTQLAIQSMDDPRYPELLRGYVVSNLEPEWSLLWDFVFTQAEKASSRSMYRELVASFLEAYSDPSSPQNVLVCGHIAVKGGHAIINNQQMRVASWAHAHPHEAGRALLLNTTILIEQAGELEPFLRSVFGK